MLRRGSDIRKQLLNDLDLCIFDLYKSKVPNIVLIPTKDDIEGDFSLITLPILKASKKNLKETALDIGNMLISRVSYINDFNVLGNYLNFVIKDQYYIEVLYSNMNSKNNNKKNKKILVEFSSPNTNKPLHLGHIRNCLLGDSISRILEADGYETYNTQIVNDRGIHICKSILAWKKWADNKTPESENIKGDKFVGYYYTLFDKEHRKQLQQNPNDNETSQILMEAKDILVRWENDDKEIIDLWNTMNKWVYKGFDKTYRSLNIKFNKSYYESQTYLKGKNVVKDGLKRGIFYAKDDGSIWVDLSDEGLDNKLLLRADKTSVYITQDIATAIVRYDDFSFDKAIYVVGNEQDYHFKILFCIFKKLGYDWADYLYHLSYAMVDLPDGKMKSREGNVVDADDLIQQMYLKAKEMYYKNTYMYFSIFKKDPLKEQIASDCKKVGMAALKYYVLRIDPKKRILFDSNESINFNGNTGPFIQYAYVRINSLIKKSNVSESVFKQKFQIDKLLKIEKDIIKKILNFEDIITLSADKYNPSILANYSYELVKKFNYYYQTVNIKKQTDSDKKNFRLQLCFFTAKVIKKSFELLGIDMPSRM